MSSLFVRSRTVIKRDIHEIEPKLAVGLLSGSITGALLEFLASQDITLPITAQYAIVIGGFFVGGWIKSSTFPTAQEIEADVPKAIQVADEVVKHPVKLTTSPIKVVPATTDGAPQGPLQPASGGKFDNILSNLPSASTGDAQPTVRYDR